MAKRRKKRKTGGIIGAVLLLAALVLLSVQLFGLAVLNRNFAAGLFAREGLPAPQGSEELLA